MAKKSKSAKAAAFIIALLIAVLAATTQPKNSRRQQENVSLPGVARTEALPQGAAEVKKIVDGDTVNVMVLNPGTNTYAEEKVRLYGINAPELRPRPGTPAADFTPEPYAAESRDFLEKLLPPGAQVRIEERGRDRYQRLLAVIRLPDGRDANRLLIEEGLARAYFLRKDERDPLSATYKEAEAQAQRAKRKIWK